MFKNYSVANGLSSSEVYDVLQDSKGYMWFCTDAGVCRYDGYSFRNFTSEHGLPDNTIFNVYEDRKGRIWFSGMAKKLSYYVPETDSIHALACNDSITKWIENTFITSLCVDEYDTLFIGVNTGKMFLKIPPEGNYKKMIPICFNDEGWKLCVFDRKNIIWGITSSSTGYGKLKVSVYDREGRNPRLFDFNGSMLMHREQYRRFTATKDGFLISEDTMLYYKKHSSLSHTSLHHSIVSIYCDRNGDIWCGTKGDGVYRYPAGNLCSTPVHYLKKTTVTGVIQDQEGGYWFSTLEHGVYYTPSFVFSYYDQSSGLSGSKIYSVLPHGEQVYCFPEDGYLNMIKGDSVRVDKSVIGSQLYDLDPAKGIIFITGDISAIYDPAKKRKTNVHDQRNFSSYFIRKAVVISPEKVCGILSGGLCLVDANTGVASFLTGNYHRLTAVYANNEDIWFGSSNGLFYLHNNKITSLGEQNALLKNRVDNICMDRHHHLWLATKGAGILIKKGERVIQLSVKEGLPSSLCKTLLMDSSDVVWVGTNRGISKISCLHDTVYKIENYSIKQGMLSDEINQLSMQGNYIYAATNQGVIKFDKTTLFTYKISPPVYITDFYVNETRQKIVPGNNYTLAHDENYIRIGFLGLSYKNPGNITYKYKLSGLDTNWNYTKNLTVQYTTLPPGDYTFLVYAINCDGINSKLPGSISFSIQPPFWKTWWFISGSCILIGLWIYWTFNTRVRRIRKTEEEKTIFNKKIAEVELKAIRAQMNPHFIFNSINSIQLYILTNDADTAYRYLSKFSKLIRNVLENSKYELISLQTEIETLELYIELEKLRFETKFEHEILVDKSIDTLLCAVPPLLIQPYVENAIWHGLMPEKTQGLLAIRFIDEQTLIKCIIEDNGIGREKSEELKANNNRNHKSLALSLSKERLEIIGHLYKNKLQINIIDKKDEAGRSTGTRVEVFIPKINFNDHDKSNYS